MFNQVYCYSYKSILKLLMICKNIILSYIRERLLIYMDF